MCPAVESVNWPAYGMITTGEEELSAAEIVAPDTVYGSLNTVEF